MKFCCASMAYLVQKGAIYPAVYSSNPPRSEMFMKPDSTAVKVNFCPACGRKVEVEFEEESE